MPRKNTGGKSIRYDVAISLDMDKALQKQLKKRKLKNASAAFRIALAEWLGDPELAEGMSAGRPKKEG